MLFFQHIALETRMEQTAVGAREIGKHSGASAGAMPQLRDVTSRRKQESQGKDVFVLFSCMRHSRFISRRFPLYRNLLFLTVPVSFHTALRRRKARRNTAQR